ncbi:hypothetical protein JB92DRAFT_2910884 [Gautieria morchelliformis]|nr:hypothetical protein JB92DRAFT_2910884 [Gautieria morchelliformis]
MTSTLVFSDPLSSKLQPSDPGLSSSHTTSLSLSSASGTTYKISSPPLPSSSPPRPHSPLPLLRIPRRTSTTVTLSHEPTSLSDLITAEHNQSYSTTLVATFATAAPTSIDTEVGSVTTVPSALATLFSSSTLCGSVVTETVILNPTLSPNTGSGSVSQLVYSSCHSADYNVLFIVTLDFRTTKVQLLLFP